MEGGDELDRAAEPDPWEAAEGLMLDEEAIQEGVRVLHESGYLDYESSSDHLLVLGVVAAVLRSSKRRERGRSAAPWGAQGRTGGELDEFVEMLRAALRDPHTVQLLQDAIGGEMNGDERGWKRPPTAPAGSASMRDAVRPTAKPVIEITQKMLDEGVFVLRHSGRFDYHSPMDIRLVTLIIDAVLDPYEVMYRDQAAP